MERIRGSKFRHLGAKGARGDPLELDWGAIIGGENPPNKRGGDTKPPLGKTQIEAFSGGS